MLFGYMQSLDPPVQTRWFVMHFEATDPAVRLIRQETERLEQLAMRLEKIPKPAPKDVPGPRSPRPFGGRWRR